MIPFGTLRKRNPLIEGVLLNPTEGATPMRQPGSLAVYLTPKKERRRTRKGNPPKKSTKKRKTRKAPARQARRSVTLTINPKRRKRNPPRYARRRMRNENPPPRRSRTSRAMGYAGERIRNFGELIRPAFMAFLGWSIPGILYKIIGANNRKKIRGWFTQNPESWARATMSAISTAALWFGSNYFPWISNSQRSLMTGSLLRLGFDSLDSTLDSTPGTTGETIRYMTGLPTATQIGSYYVGKQWPANIPPPAGTALGPQGLLVPAVFEDEEYPYLPGIPGQQPGYQYGPQGQQMNQQQQQYAAYLQWLQSQGLGIPGQQQQPGMVPGATIGAQMGSIGYMPGQGGVPQFQLVQPQFQPQALKGYGYAQLMPASGLNGYAVQSLGGYAFNTTGGSRPFPRPF